MDAVIFIIQLMVMSLFILEANTRNFLISIAAIILVDYLQADFANYYLRCTMYDIVQIVFALVFLSRTKAAVVSCICLFSVWMNLYEHFSTYQTFLYNYRDIIQFWLAELMIVVAIWKTKWRKIACLYSQKKC